MRTILSRAAVGALLLLFLSGCAAPSGIQQAVQQARGAVSSLPAATAPTSPVPAGAPAQEDIRRVVEQANQAQQEALAQHKPELMRDTSTSSYYDEMVQTNADLANSGVTAIQLVKIEWGDITVNGTTAQATTFETWRTTYNDGTTDEGRDRNVYSLVQQNGSWKIQGDEHPDAGQGVPGPGGAQPAPAPPGNPVPPAPVAPAGKGQSHNWSGYAATGGNFTSVTGTWTVPQPADGSTGADAAWVGIGGVRGRDLIQAGTQAIASSSGHVHYQAWIETLPQFSHPVPLTIKPGDSVTVTLTEQSPGLWQITLKDNTTGQRYSETRQYTSSHSSAEWVEEAPSGGRRLVPLDNFGTIQFTAGSAVKDGQTVTIAGAGARPITMINASGQPLATPSALGADGSSFSVTRTSAASTAPPFPGAGSRSIPGSRGRGRPGGSPIPFAAWLFGTLD